MRSRTPRSDSLHDMRSMLRNGDDLRAAGPALRVAASAPEEIMALDIWPDFDACIVLTSDPTHRAADSDRHYSVDVLIARCTTLQMLMIGAPMGFFDDLNDGTISAANLEAWFPVYTSAMRTWHDLKSDLSIDPLRATVKWVSMCLSWLDSRAERSRYALTHALHCAGWDRGRRTVNARPVEWQRYHTYPETTALITTEAIDRHGRSVPERNSWCKVIGRESIGNLHVRGRQPHSVTWPFVVPQTSAILAMLKKDDPSA